MSSDPEEPPKPFAYQSNRKHGRGRRGRVSPEPRNPKAAYEVSRRISPNSNRRIGVDRENLEIVIFHAHFVRDDEFEWHGFVVEWEDLKQAQRNALLRANLVNRRGEIL